MQNTAPTQTQLKIVSQHMAGFKPKNKRVEMVIQAAKDAVKFRNRRPKK